MDLEQWVLEADAAGAIVFNALRGDIGHSGWLQRYLASEGVPFTGPSWDAAAVAGHKVRAYYRCCLFWLTVHV